MSVIGGDNYRLVAKYLKDDGTAVVKEKEYGRSGRDWEVEGFKGPDCLRLCLSVLYFVTLAQGESTNLTLDLSKTFGSSLPVDKYKLTVKSEEGQKVVY